MGLFTKKEKFKFHQIPSTPEQTAARSHLTGLYQDNINIAPREVAGMSPVQQQLQGYLSGMAGNQMDNFQLSQDHLRATLSGDYDPRTSLYYQGVRGELDEMKGQAQAQTQQHAQLGGMARSSPAAGAISQTGRQYDQMAAQTLGQLTDAERQRQMQAAGMLPQQDAQMAQSLQLQQQMDMERQIQQERNNAMYEAFMGELMMRYQQQAGIAMSILGEQRYIGVQSGGGLTDLGFFMNASSQAASAMAGGG